MLLNNEILLEYCIKLNPNRAKKCNEFVEEIEPFSNFIIKSLNNTNLTSLILIILIILLISFTLTNISRKF